MTESKFNIFKILSKDDKELIHSAFIQFLIGEESISFCKDFLNIPSNIVFKNAEIEQSYTLDVGGRRKKRLRIDVQAINENNNNFLIIENKFKSFPYEEQLMLYNQLCDIEYKGCSKHKFLLCFDKGITALKEMDWKILDYSELLAYLKENEIKFKGDKLIMVKHYIIFLDEYVESYKNSKQDARSLFERPLKSKKTKFFLNLCFSALRLRLEHRFREKGILDVKYHVSPGNTTTPLINIIPLSWKHNYELLIQLQGNKLKLYCHHNGVKNSEKEFKQFGLDLVKNIEEMEDVWSQGKFKKMTAANPKSYYIYQTLLTDQIEKDKMDLPSIEDAVMRFYHNIDNVLNKIYPN